MGLLDQVLGAALGRIGQGRGGLGDLVSGASRGAPRQAGASQLLMSLLPAVVAMLANRGGGGLGSLLEQFRAAGLDQQARSWVSSGENIPITRDDVASALGDRRLDEIAAQAGVSTDEASGGLAALLPELVNELTPQGDLPSQDQVDDSLASLQRSLGI